MAESSWNDIDTQESLLKTKTLLPLLLYDNTTKHNIMWMTTQYKHYGKGYQETDTIKTYLITGRNEGILKPRTKKTIEEQEKRTREQAEIFTPSFIVNKQNNLIDSAWFGTDAQFNKENGTDWISTKTAIQFPKGKTWKDYVTSNRLEMACGEAPYLTSRYDASSGFYIPVSDRVGLLDRKLRVITENCGTPDEWTNWAGKALESIYGFDWQGDNVLLARENILCSTIEAYQSAFQIIPNETTLCRWAKIIAWNIWQMDGVKGVIPNSCHDYEMKIETLLGEEQKVCNCPGCQTDNISHHNGKYCRIMDWNSRKSIRYADMVKEGQ